jgi:hypothetical protein
MRVRFMHLTKFSDYALRVVLNRANPMLNLISINDI